MFYVMWMFSKGGRSVYSKQSIFVVGMSEFRNSLIGVKLVWGTSASI